MTLISSLSAVILSDSPHYQRGLGSRYENAPFARSHFRAVNGRLVT